MPSPQVEIIERTAFDGPLSPWAAAIVGLALAALAAWLLMREREAVGRWSGAVMFLLRIVAFALVLWMLAGPVKLTIERLSTPQTVAIVADSSGSMNVVDPPDGAADARWQAAGAAEPEAADLVAADRVATDLAYAARLASDFARAVADHRSISALDRIADSLKKTTDRSAEHAREFAGAVDDDGDLAERAERLGDVLTGEVAEALARVTADLKKGDDADLHALALGGDALQTALVDAARRGASLAADAAEAAAEEFQQQLHTAGARRGEKVAAALATLEEGYLRDVADDVRLERFRFDDAIEPATADQWQTIGAASDPAAVDDSLFGEEPSANEQPQPGTNLTQMLEHLAKLRSQKGVSLAVLFSDGRHNSTIGLDPQDAAAEKGEPPLFIVPVGSSAPLRDVLIHRVDAPATVIKGDQIKIDVIVTAFECPGEKTRIELRKQGKLVDSKPLVFRGSQADCRITFLVPAEVEGWQELELNVVGLPEEASAANNLAAASLEVVRDNIKIMLADRQPRWEFRYLQQLFARDKHFKCDELVFAPEPAGTGALAATATLPRDDEGWNRYEAVILGDLSPQEMSRESEQALDRYVREHGGNLVVIAGTDAMPGAFAGRPLADLLPVERSTLPHARAGYSLVLADEARFQSAVLIADDFDASRQAWQALCRQTPLYGLSDYCKPRPTARTIIEAAPLDSAYTPRVEPGDQPERAFMAWRQVGAGRVVYIAAPQTYLLRYRTGDRLHHRFWGQLLRWITAPQMGAGSELVKLSTDRTRYEEGRPVDATVWLRDKSGRPVAGAAVTATAESPDGDKQEIDLETDGAVPGRYVGKFERLATGAYEITPRGAAVAQLIAESPKDAPPPRTLVSIHGVGGFEMMNTRCNRPLLEQLAAATGGQVISPTAIGEVLELASLAPEVTESVERKPLWNRWGALAGIVGCLSLEWLMRKHMGLV